MELWTTLDASFLTALNTLVWVALPIYGSCLGVALFLLAPCPMAAGAKPGEGDNPGVNLSFQKLFYAASLLVMALYRGHEGPFFQGQLTLTHVGAKFLFLIAALLGFGVHASMSLQTRPARFVAPSLPVWALGPSLAVCWALLPLMTQLMTSLLVLELVGVVLVWALTHTASSAARSEHGSAANSPRLVYALITFIWASGLSAITLLIGLGLTSLEGAQFNFFLSSLDGGLGAAGSPFTSSLFAFTALFKFLMGSGQLLLVAWYRFLPLEGLAFYLLLYYPAQLLVGVSFFLSFFIGAAALHAAALLALTLGTALNLAATLGAQTSPALTLAGSSFVGLSLVLLALLGLPGTYGLRQSG